MDTYDLIFAGGMSWRIFIICRATSMNNRRSHGLCHSRSSRSCRSYIEDIGQYSLSLRFLGVSDSIPCRSLRLVHTPEKSLDIYSLDGFFVILRLIVTYSHSMSGSQVSHFLVERLSSHVVGQLVVDRA